MHAVSFCLSKDIKIPFRVRLKSIQASPESFVSLQISSKQFPLTFPVVCPCRTSTWQVLPVNYSQLPLDAQLDIEIFSYDPQTLETSFIARYAVELFDQNDYTLKKGYQPLGKEFDSFTKKLKQHESKEMVHVDWLDDLIKPVKENCIELAHFDTFVVFSDVKYSNITIPCVGSNPRPYIFDPDQYRDYNQDDPIETKFRRLERMHQTSEKPTLANKQKLFSILERPLFEKLSPHEKNLVWQFRFFLLSAIVNGNASNSIVNFIKCVDWSSESEVDEFFTLLAQVDVSKFILRLEIVDCLELFRSSESRIRSLAIDRLKQASDSDLELFLVQLVHLLKNDTSEPSISEEEDEIRDIETELSSTDPSEYAFVDSAYQQQAFSSLSVPFTSSVESPLAQFLVDRCTKNPRLANFFYWYVKVEVDEEKRTNTASFYQNVLHFFLSKLELNYRAFQLLQRQIKVISQVHVIALQIKTEFRKESTPAKKAHLKRLLRESLSKFDSFLMPLDPSVKIVSCVFDDSSVFKSSLSPLKVTFKTSANELYPVMYKIGDDLRQDQFVIQIISVMDKIMQNENLDLKLKPYKILSSGPVEGLIEFVPNESLFSILNDHNSILAYLQTHNPDPTAPLKVAPEVMDNYVRSCAGYCVITYIIGVGDRHLENLLLTKDGCFFHADFGYIVGDDPKPFPPLMKLPIQVIEGMGGLENENYKKFCDYCFISYIILRKNSNLILNLFQLMIDSNIPVLQTPSYRLAKQGHELNSNEFEKLELVLKIKEKFVLELSDEEAVLHFQNLINDSVTAFLPVVIDRLHSLAQYWRA